MDMYESVGSFLKFVFLFIVGIILIGGFTVWAGGKMEEMSEKTKDPDSSFAFGWLAWVAGLLFIGVFLNSCWSCIN